MPADLKHLASPDFWDCYNRLPEDIQKLADKNFTLLKSDAKHPSLRLTQVENLWLVRVGRSYRALGLNESGTVVWFWIGTHAEYDRHLK